MGMKIEKKILMKHNLMGNFLPIFNPREELLHIYCVHFFIAVESLCKLDVTNLIHTLKILCHALILHKYH